MPKIYSKNVRLFLHKKGSLKSEPDQILLSPNKRAVSHIKNQTYFINPLSKLGVINTAV